MLIDQLLTDPLWCRVDFLGTDIRGRMSKSTKFVLERDFAMAADEFSLDIGNLGKVLGFCRLPYCECWIEVAGEDRRSFARSTVPLALTESKCKRIGWLLTQLDQSGSWSAQMFWSFAEQDRTPARFGMPAIAVSGSGAMLIFDFGAASTGDVYRVGTFREADFMASRPALERTMYRQLASGSEDWAGEVGYLVAVLALLNSKNASETALVENAGVRKSARQPDGMRFSYHVVRIPRRYKVRHIAVDGEPTGSQLRAHFVRGHFKVRKTGVFFWSAYQRGNPVLGFAHKDYAVELAQ